MKPFTEVRKALYTVLDQHEDIRELTGRNSGNVMSWKYFDASAVPGLFHQMVVAVPRIGVANYEVSMQLTAIAKTMETAEQLLDTAIELLTQPALETAGYDMAVINIVHRDVGEIDFSRTIDEGDETERADADLTLWITT